MQKLERVGNIPRGISSDPTSSLPTSISPHTKAAAAPGSPFLIRIGSINLVIAIAHLQSASPWSVDIQRGSWTWFPDSRITSCKGDTEVPAEYCDLVISLTRQCSGGVGAYREIESSQNTYYAQRIWDCTSVFAPCWNWRSILS